MRGQANHTRWLLCALLLLVAACTTAAGRIIYVDADAPGMNDGSSWENAYNYLQEALADAETSVKPIEIRIAQGIYRPNEGLMAIPEFDWRTTTFQLINGVTLKGGYAGFGEPDPNARDIEAYETILSGDLNANDGTEFTNNEENSYHVVTGSGTDETAVLDGFTITAGNANGDWLTAPSGRGGGMYNDESRPTLTNCTFCSNSAYYGGAMYNDNSDPRLVNCSFENNSAETYYEPGPGAAGAWGGEGGAICNNNSSPSLDHCTFADNTQAAMYNSGSSPTLNNCIFIGNTSWYGGAIYNWNSEPILTNCSFNNNRSFAKGGAFAIKGHSSATLLNCIFVGNRAGGYGGGVHSYGSSATFINCTFAANEAHNGKALECSSYPGDDPSILQLANCIHWNGGEEIWNDDGSSITITFSDVQGGFPGDGNTDADPRFAEPGYWEDPYKTPDNPVDDVYTDGDYHLKSQAGRWDANEGLWTKDDVTSPCIDAGDSLSPIGHEPFPNGGVINMGAYGGTAEASKSPSGLNVKYGGGTGEPDNPYLIYTAEQMNTIGTEPNDWDKHFKLMADIDLNGYTGTNFNIIGIGGRFTGVFDGNGHTISNFSYTSSNGLFIGLFGYISGQSAQIKDLGLITPDIDAEAGSHVGSLVGLVSSGTITNCYAEGGSVSGEDAVGGLVGWNHGNINDCYSTCNVYGKKDVGGLVGHNDTAITNCSAGGEVFGRDCVGGLAGRNSGTIKNSSATGSVTGEKRSIVSRENCSTGGLIGHNSGPLISCSAEGDVSGDTRVGGLVGNSSGSIINCYAMGGVLGTDFVGGLVGHTSSSIADCYAIGDVSGTTYVGGLVGQKGDESIVLTSFWDIQKSGQLISDGGISRITAQMQMAGTFLNAGWDFAGETANGTEDIWWIDEGKDYPRLWWELAVKYGGGTGESNDPYLIYTAEQMNTIGAEPNDWDKHFKLMSDIDLSAYTGNQFNIIGGNPPFTGVFDGNDHIISNFTYVSTDRWTCGGLFGSVNDPNAEIKNLRLIDPNVFVEEGLSVELLIASLSQGIISNCHVENGHVAGLWSVGGLVGDISGDVKITPESVIRRGEGILRYCSTNGVNVSGDRQVGGLVGEHSRGTITDCHSTGIVAGSELVGGLVGENSDTVTDCFSAASVTGGGMVGGLIGYNSAGANGRIMHCCSSGSVSGDWAVGGLVGLNATRVSNCYSTGDVTGNDYVGGLVGSNSAHGWITLSYSTGLIIGDANVGGLVGDNYKDGGYISGSFWDMETSRQTTSDGGTGKTTYEMKIASTFLDAGWDFVGESENGTEDIWAICQGVDYPKLTWQFIVGDFDDDGDVDFGDFGLLALRWHNTDGSFWCGAGGTDLTNDGHVNIADLDEFAEKWLAEIP